MKIVLDEKKCFGCGNCVTLAPKSFQLNSENKAQPLTPTGDNEETIKIAVESCPVQAIMLK